MKKYTKIFVLAALLLTCGIGANSLNTAEKIDGFEEVAQDRVGNVGEEKLLKSTFVGKDETIDVSKIFVQYGNYVKEETTYNALRFAVAVKGDISSISFQRGHVEGKKDVEEENVTTVYRGISAGNGTYYYNPEAPDAVDGLTTTEEYAGSYYWACYTIGFTDASFEVSNIPLSLTVNDIDYGSRKASLAEVRYGLHDHDYSNYSHTDARHYKTCALCNTIDDTSYENHNYNVKFSKEYLVGETFSTSDVILEYDCVCEHEFFSNSLLTISKYPESSLVLGDSITVANNGEEKNISLPVVDKFKDYEDNWSISGTTPSITSNESFITLNLAKQDNMSYITNSNFVAPNDSFDLMFKARIKSGRAEVTLRSEYYNVRIVFDLTSVGKRFISSNYNKGSNLYPSTGEIDTTGWHEYKLSVNKGNNNTFTYDIYIDNQSEPLLSNLSTAFDSTNHSKLTKIGVAQKSVAGSNNLLDMDIEYLKLQLK